MRSQKRYSRAPITEAVIALSVKPAEEIEAADLERCGIVQKDAYPTQAKLNTSNFNIGTAEVGEPVFASALTRHIGYAFTSADAKQVFQVRLDGFTMSRLAPYDSWEPFRNEARRLWNVYRQIAKPNQIVRLAVRYINRLDLPLPVPELKDYLRTSPEVSPDLPQALAGFFMQLNLPQKDINSTLMLNQTIIEPHSPDVASVVLDIDLFRDSDLPADEDGLWHLCEELRVRKNKIFEACITERTRELIR